MDEQAEKIREMMRSGTAAGAPVPSQTKSARKRKTRIITIASGKGGVGKTNMSVNMALAYARLGKHVVVMDADLGLANVNVVLKVIPKFSLYNVIRKQKTMRDIIVTTEYGIDIVPGASGFSQIANLTEEERQYFIKEINTLSNYDIIIIDTGAGVHSNVIDFIAAADDAIIITTPEPTAITDAYGLVKIIATEIDNLEMGLKLVVNSTRNASEGKTVADRISSIANQFLNIKLEYLGFVYEDASVSQAVLKQKPFMVEYSRCKASACVQHIVDRLEKIEVRDSGGFNNMVQRIFRSQP